MLYYSMSICGSADHTHTANVSLHMLYTYVLVSHTYCVRHQSTQFDLPRSGDALQLRPLYTTKSFIFHSLLAQNLIYRDKYWSVHCLGASMSFGSGTMTLDAWLSLVTEQMLTMCTYSVIVIKVRLSAAYRWLLITTCPCVPTGPMIQQQINTKDAVNS